MTAGSPPTPASPASPASPVSPGSPGSPVTRVVLVDDHPLVRAGLRALLDGEPDLEVVAEAADGERALDVCREHRPDVVLMDLSMPGVGGVEATRHLVGERPDVHVVVLTSLPDPGTVHEALAAGAVGYLLKDADPTTVVDAVRAAAAGGAPLDPRAARAILPGRVAPPAPAAGARDSRPSDTTGPEARGTTGASVAPSGPRVVGREADVLRLLALGLPNKQIAVRLGISERTVKAHVGSVFRRIGVADRTSAALWARDHGLGPAPGGGTDRPGGGGDRPGGGGDRPGGGGGQGY